jgi:hypothetical protein
VAWDDFLKFLELFLVEKCDMAWSDFIKFLELFFNREMWYVMCTPCMPNYYLCDFLEIIDNEKEGKWWGRWWCVYPTYQKICYKDL